MSQPELVHTATITAQLEGERALIPDGPQGTRLVAPVGDTTMVGPNINAKSLGGTAGDWLTISPDGTYGTLDVRITFKTDDGVYVYCEYKGRLDFATARVISAPLFQVGDERYDWLNRSQFIGDGSMNEESNVLTYEIYEVRST